MSTEDYARRPNHRIYETPTKGDLDRNLSTIMHSAHHKARAERAQLTSEFAARGMGSSTALIASVVGCLDKIHSQSIAEAMHVVRDFAAKMNVAPREITPWARPHLENLGNTVLGQIFPAGFPAEAHRSRAQYALVFQQRLDGALRDIEIGFIQGRSIGPAGADNPSRPTQQPSEIVSLKPGLWGISIDLKELWRRFIRRWR